MTRPNILIFCTDEQRGDHLGCMGHPHLTTPNIDRLAAEGTLFRNCYTSTPICLPARATMLTGLTNRATGIIDNGTPLGRSIPTVPALLAESGYRTHSVGKLHLREWSRPGVADEKDVAANPERRIYWDWPNHWQGEHYTKFPDNYYGFQTVELANGHVSYVYGDYVTWLEANHPGAYQGYTCSNRDPGPLAIAPQLHYNTWIADRSIEFIGSHVSGTRRRGPGESSPPGSRHSSSPFFLWCSFPDPHEPFAAVREWSDFYDDVEIELPQNTTELSPHSRSETMNRLGLGTEVQDPKYVKQCLKQTYGMISHIDEQLGRVLDALERFGVAGNTVVMFISDHGDQLGEHGLFYKSIYPYDGHAHIPFVAKVPWAKEKGRAVEDVVSLLDLAPTVLDLAGVAHPHAQASAEPRLDQATRPASPLPGEVLTPVLEGRARPVRKNALVEFDRLESPLGTVQLRSLVTNDFKLVYYTPLGETMLFDRRNDPQELRNLAGEAEYRSVVDEMHQQLRAELDRTEMGEITSPLAGRESHSRMCLAPGAEDTGRAPSQQHYGEQTE